MSGHAVQIVHTKANCITLDVKALEDILLDEKVKDKKVVVISVAGAYRKGKSFFLCFLLRYLRAKGSSEWMGDPNEPLKGFIWKTSPDRVTTGIVMWSEAFIITMPNNEEVAVILMDTEGTFAYNSTMKNCATIFGLSTLLSSVQVYNLYNLIQGTDLQYLQLFTEFGKLGLENVTKERSLQNLLFLIRNWENPLTHNYGMYGGENYLNRVLSTEENQGPELKNLREHLRSCFSKISCFLMPHPGKKVAIGDNFDGRLSDIDEEFKQHLNVLVPLLLSSDKLVIKEVNGQHITAAELFLYFKGYVSRFQDKKLPPITSLYEVTREVHNQIAVDDAKEYYKTAMEKICCLEKPSISSMELKDKHRVLKMAAITEFQTKKKLGDRQFSDKYEQMLMKKLDKIYGNYEKTNEVKLRQEKAVNNAKAYYKTHMDKSCCLEKPSMSPTELRDRHEKQKRKAIIEFEKATKAGEEQFTDKNGQQLIKELDTMYESYVKSNEEKLSQEKAVNDAKAYYKTFMDAICCLETPLMSSAELQDKHNMYKKSAIVQFQEAVKDGKKRLTDKYEVQLSKELDKMYNDYKKLNVDKRKRQWKKIETALVVAGAVVCGAACAAGGAFVAPAVAIAAAIDVAVACAIGAAAGGAIGVGGVLVPWSIINRLKGKTTSTTPNPTDKGVVNSDSALVIRK